jgi:AcrR family transcriptional regulator
MTDKKAVSLGRVIEIAGEEFSQSRYEDVSVAKITQRARCSTSTIYDVCGGKVELFRHDMLLRLTHRAERAGHQRQAGATSSAALFRPAYAIAGGPGKPQDRAGDIRPGHDHG